MHSIKTDLDHIETFTPRDDPAGVLSRFVRSTLDQHGPLKFADLWLLTPPQIEPATLHDALNNMIAAGFIHITHTGLYHGPLPF